MQEQIGRYEIRREIGRGGMATVYLAYDPRFQRQVAIKVLPRQFTHDPKYLARFEQEARVIATLEHPAIVPVHDFGEEDDAPYLVMRHMAGGSLRDRLRGEPLSLAQISSIFERLAPALDKAHQAGIVHRDIKPANILFDEDGNPYLADFGIARMAEASQSTTGVIGTPAYMSPEQVIGKKGQVIDGRADIYALGVILYELLTGEQPYEGETSTQQMMAHVLEPVPNVLETNPDLPPAAQDVINKVMAKKPDDRYNTAAELALAVQALSGLGETAVLVGPPEIPPIDEINKAPKPKSQEVVVDSEELKQVSAPGGEKDVTKVPGTIAVLAENEDLQRSKDPNVEELSPSVDPTMGTPDDMEHGGSKPPPPPTRSDDTTGSGLPRWVWFTGVLALLILGFLIIRNVLEPKAEAEQAAPPPNTNVEPIATPTEGIEFVAPLEPQLVCEDEIGCVEIAPDEPILLASSLVISGPNAQLGTDSQWGVELALDFRDEVMGHPVDLQVEDDGCSVEGGQTSATAIISDPQIVAVVGTSCSTAGVPAAKIISDAGYAMVSPSNTAQSLTDPEQAWQPGYLRTAYNDEVQGRAIAAFAINELDITKAAAIHDGSLYSSSLASVFSDAFEELGGEIVAFKGESADATNVETVLTTVATSGPEFIYYPVFIPLGSLLTNTAKTIPGLENVILAGADGIQSPDFLKNTAGTSEGMYVSGPDLNFTGSFYQEEFLPAYIAKYGTEPMAPFHAHAFDATNMILDAVEKVAQQGSDGTLLIGRQALRDALYATEGMEGVTGTITCNEFGDCADPKIAVSQVQNGEFVPIWRFLDTSADQPAAELMDSDQAASPSSSDPPLRAELGGQWERPMDSMTMVYVPEGVFPMGSEAGYDEEKPVHDVSLDAFWIDRLEVTNSQFAQFVEATGYETTAESEGFSFVLSGGELKEVEGANWQHPQGPGSDLNGLADHPVIHMTWHDAEAYCEWVGARLPTEAEWEYAARGPEGLTYTWGDDFEGQKTNYCDVNCPISVADTTVDDGYEFTAPVGNYPGGESWVGAGDMNGNVFEWVSDWFNEDYYASSVDRNPQGPDSGDYKVLRGGAWISEKFNVRSAIRGAVNPVETRDYVGFRCVVSPGI